MGRPMKTLQLVGDSKYGGATYLIIEWCKYLLAKDCEVDVLSTDSLTRRALQDIARVKVIDSIQIPREIDAGADARAFAQLLRLFSRERYDVVHSYTATPGVLGRIAARLGGVPAIFHHQAAWTVDGSSSLRERLFFTPLEYLATVASTRGICVSNAVAREAEVHHLAPRRKLTTIPNGIDPSRFLHPTDAGALRRELGVASDTVIIGTTGRLAPDKDVPTLLSAADALRTSFGRPFLFVVVGDGPDRSALEAMANGLAGRDVVRFLGFRSDIPGLLGGMDLFVTTSLREGLSISLLEAMAASLPIVATRIPPNAELIEHEKTGLLVEVRSPGQVAGAIARFAREPELAMRCGASARKVVLDKYTLSRMFAQTWDLYDEFAGERHG
jgi:glycosyltransferase involved in cell wall biosynthesis